jgi:hypothetical protein
MKRAIALGIFAVSMLLGVAACSDGSSGTTQGNTGQKEKKIPVPPRQDLLCAATSEDTCAEDCCNADRSPNPSGGKACKAWLGNDPIAKCKQGVSKREPNFMAPLE